MEKGKGEKVSLYYNRHASGMSHKYHGITMIQKYTMNPFLADIMLNPLVHARF